MGHGTYLSGKHADRRWASLAGDGIVAKPDTCPGVGTPWYDRYTVLKTPRSSGFLNIIWVPFRLEVSIASPGNERP